MKFLMKSESMCFLACNLVNKRESKRFEYADMHIMRVCMCMWQVTCTLVVLAST